MHTFIDLLINTGCLAVFVYGCIEVGSYCLLWSFLIYLFYPFLLEPATNATAILLHSETKYKEKHQKKHSLIFPKKTHFVYHQRYNITACGIEKLHPFDSTKYARIYKKLLRMGVIQNKEEVFIPDFIPRAVLLSLGVSKWYLLKLCYSIFICKVVEVPVCFLPAAILRWRVLNPQLFATQGSIDASCLALEKGWAVNLSGGYHHCHKQGGGGFCLFPDISLTADHLFKYHGDKVKKVMIVDLDAHQGNGHERDFLYQKDKVFIVDFFNNRVYPGDMEAKNAIQSSHPISYMVSDSQYLELMNKHIQKAIEQFQPNFVIYNAGTDCLEGDPLGGLSLTKEGIIQRDQLMFQMCISRQIPILMVLSGGYQQVNAPIIANSLENINTQFSRNKNLQKIVCDLNNDNL